MRLRIVLVICFIDKCCVWARALANGLEDARLHALCSVNFSLSFLWKIRSIRKIEWLGPNLWSLLDDITPNQSYYWQLNENLLNPWHDNQDNLGYPNWFYILISTCWAWTFKISLSATSWHLFKATNWESEMHDSQSSILFRIEIALQFSEPPR